MSKFRFRICSKYYACAYCGAAVSCGRNGVVRCMKCKKYVVIQDDQVVGWK